MLLLLLPVSTATIQPLPDATASLRATLPSLQKNLGQAVVRFWYPRVIDRTHGGYRIAFDAIGTPMPDGSKMIVTQARMLWLFARLARAEPREVDLPDRHVARLSVGQRQQLNLALAFLGAPRTAVLDEPTASLDADRRDELWRDLDALREAGGAVVFATQLRDEAARADRVVRLEHGRVA